MVQFVFCLLMLVPLVALPTWVMVGSTVLGIVVSVVCLVLAVPVTLAALAHLDLLRARSRYGLRDDELAEFVRLVPLLASQPKLARLPARETKRLAKDAAAEAILEQRRSASPRDGGGPEGQPALGLPSARSPYAARSRHTWTTHKRSART